jgi:sugar transferase (PEP-CTERM/EpsH1 system associated)
MMRPELLMLVHRIPYPPNKGDKIRAWHLLEFLTRHYEVHLGAFVDAEEDWQHADTLRRVCAETCLLPLNPRYAKLRSLTGLLTGQALTLPYYASGAMQRWVDAVLARRPVRHVVVYSSAVAQFVIRAREVQRIMDFVDLDSDKWLQYSPSKPWPLSWLYRREGRKLLQWEREVARVFDVSLFVSPAEASDFRRLAPESAHKIGSYVNGVDLGYFSPDHDFASPYPEGSCAIVFTGAMDYWPNVDAVNWFAREIFPEIRRAHPDAVFAVVGSRPATEVLALRTLPGVMVTGYVPDVRPYLKHAALVVAPLRIARGIQNKVLEAMAMGKTTIASPEALAGIEAERGREILCAGGAGAFIRTITQTLANPDGHIGERARRRMLADYDWDAILGRMMETHLKAHGQDSCGVDAGVPAPRERYA